MTFFLLLAFTLTTPPSKDGSGPWVPADTGSQDCGMDYHRHSLDLDEHGHYVVNKQKGEPDIVFDGKCHDEHENVVGERKVLPKASKQEKTL